MLIIRPVVKGLLDYHLKPAAKDCNLKQFEKVVTQQLKELFQFQP